MSASVPFRVVAKDGTALDADHFAAPVGGDDAVILCHGIIQNRRSFEVPSFSVPALLNDAGFDVYAVDMRGRDGGSSRHDFATYTDDDAVAFALAVAARHRSVSWVGHSMGGLIGVAMQAPVNAVVALASPLLPGTEALRLLSVDRAIARLSRTTARRGLAFPGKAYSRAFVALQKGLDRGVVPFPLPLWKPGSFDDARDLAFTLDNAFANDGHHVLADLCELGFSNGLRAGRVAFSDRLRSFSSPLLCVAGSADALAPTDSVHALWSRAGSKQRQFIEVDAGHIDLVLGNRARTEVWPAVLDFLDQHRRQARPRVSVPGSPGP